MAFGAHAGDLQGPKEAPTVSKEITWTMTPGPDVTSGAAAEEACRTQQFWDIDAQECLRYFSAEGDDSLVLSIKFASQTKDLERAFPQLEGQELLRRGRNSMINNSYYQFKPHYIEDNTTTYYFVNCSSISRAFFKDLCQMESRHAVFADDPNKSFHVEPATDVETAIWVYRAFQNIRHEPRPDEPEAWDGNDPTEGPEARLSGIEVAGRVATITYRTDGCTWNYVYEIVGDNEGLKYVRYEPGMCI